MDILSSLLRSPLAKQLKSNSPKLLEKNSEGVTVQVKGQTLNLSFKEFPELKQLIQKDFSNLKVWDQIFSKLQANTNNPISNALNQPFENLQKEVQKIPLRHQILNTSSQFPPAIAELFTNWSKELSQSIDRLIDPNLKDPVLEFKAALKNFISFRENPIWSSESPELKPEQKKLLTQLVLSDLNLLAKALIHKTNSDPSIDTSNLLKAIQAEKFSWLNLAKNNNFAQEVPKEEIKLFEKQLLKSELTQLIEPKTFKQAPQNPLEQSAISPKELANTNTAKMPLDLSTKQVQNIEKIEIQQFLKPLTIPIKALNSPSLPTLLNQLLKPENNFDLQLPLKSKPLRLDQDSINPAKAATYSSDVLKSSKPISTSLNTLIQIDPKSPQIKLGDLIKTLGVELPASKPLSNFSDKANAVSSLEKPSITTLDKATPTRSEARPISAPHAIEPKISLTPLTVNLLNQIIEHTASLPTKPTPQKIIEALQFKLSTADVKEPQKVDSFIQKVLFADQLHTKNPVKQILQSPLFPTETAKAFEVAEKQIENSTSLKAFEIPHEIQERLTPLRESGKPFFISTEQMNEILTKAPQEESKSFEGVKERVWVDQIDSKGSREDVLYYQNQKQGELQPLKVSIKDKRKSSGNKKDSLQFKIQTSNPTFGHTQIYGDLQQIAQQENQKIDFKIYTEKSPSKTALLSKRDFLAKELIDINWILEDLAIFEPQLKLSSFKNRGANKNLDIEA